MAKLTNKEIMDLGEAATKSFVKKLYTKGMAVDQICFFLDLKEKRVNKIIEELGL